MALTIKIELVASYDTPDRDVVLLKIVRAIAKQLVTQASLLGDGRDPKIKVTAGDNFNPVREIKLFAEDGSELDSEIDTSKYRPGSYGLSAITLNTLMKELPE